MKKHILLYSILAIFLISCNSKAQEKDEKKFILEKKVTKKDNLILKDLVPNAETAIKIAEAIWLPIYGKKIYEKKPFIAKLINSNVWVVEGTVHSTKGGAPYIEIQKKDCKILKVYHEK
jgi:hypothetical protein